jgi:hypothetical protein
MLPWYLVPELCVSFSPLYFLASGFFSQYLLFLAKKGSLFRKVLAHFDTKLSQKGQSNKEMSCQFYGNRTKGIEKIGRVEGLNFESWGNQP